MDFCFDDLVDDLDLILADASFDLKSFVLKHFELVVTSGSDDELETGLEMEDHINQLWRHLKRDPDTHIEGDSKIPLRRPYIVPGGRFQEM